MNTNIFHHNFTALGYNSPSVTCWYLVRLFVSVLNAVAITAQFENNLDCGSVFANSQQKKKRKKRNKKTKTMHSFEFQVYSFLVSIFIIYHDIFSFPCTLTLVLFPRWSCRGWMAPVASHDPLNRTYASIKTKKIIQPLAFAEKPPSHSMSNSGICCLLLCRSCPVALWLVSVYLVGDVILVFFCFVFFFFLNYC